MQTCSVCLMVLDGSGICRLCGSEEKVGFGSTDKVSDGTYQPHLIDPKLFEQQTSVFKHKHRIVPR